MAKRSTSKTTKVPKLPCPVCGARMAYNKRTEKMACISGACRGRVAVGDAASVTDAAKSKRRAKQAEAAVSPASSEKATTGKRRSGPVTREAIAAPPPGPKGQSELEKRFAAAWAAGGNGMVPKREFEFFPGRKWRFDFAFPDYKVACECDGGQWAANGGRHNTDSDKDKCNNATAEGWSVLRFSGNQIKTKPEACVALILRTLIKRGAPVAAAPQDEKTP